MCYQHSTPLIVNRQTIRQKSQSIFKIPGPAVRLAGGKAIAIAVHRASTRIPELANILRGVAQDGVCKKHRFNGRYYDRIITVIRLDPPEKKCLCPASKGNLPSTVDLGRSFPA